MWKCAGLVQHRVLGVLYDGSRVYADLSTSAIKDMKSCEITYCELRVVRVRLLDGRWKHGECIV